MTKENICEILQIECNDKNIEEKESRHFVIKDQNISTISLETLREHIRIEFWRCTFQENIFISDKKYICFDLTFGDCIFEKKIIFRKIHECSKSNMVFQTCDFKDKVDFSKSKNMKTLKINNSRFYMDTIFRGCSFDEVEIKENSFADFVNFDNAIFEDKVKIEYNIFKKNFRFVGIKAQENTINFKKNVFEGKATFHGTYFGNVGFDLTKFLATVDFSNAHFYQDVIFKSVLFCKTSLWDNTKFSKTCSFQDVFFNGATFNNVSFNTKPTFCRCTFERLFDIKHQYIQYSFEDLEDEEKAGNIDCTDVRGLFRKLKSNRLVHHNIIDASELHTQELYVREIELRKKEEINLKEKIEKWQLWFYRNTSDHHTDLLRSFNTLIALIGIFGFLCGSVVLGFDYFVFGYQKGFNILQLKGFFLDNINKSITSHLLEYFVGNISLVFVFLGLFLGVIWKCSREAFVLLGYIATFGFLAISPKYLIPAMSLFGGKWVALNPLGTIGGIYTLLFGFLTYSFIKTARKNSIIPN